MVSEIDALLLSVLVEAIITHISIVKEYRESTKSVRGWGGV